MWDFAYRGKFTKSRGHIIISVHAHGYIANLQSMFLLSLLAVSVQNHPDLSGSNLLGSKYGP